MIPNEYGGGFTAPVREYIEPARVDPKTDRVTLPDLLQETGWTVDLLDYAIGSYKHPKPVGRRQDRARTPVYQRSEIATWREKMSDDMRRLGTGRHHRP
jgi:hypothetical protein